MTMTSSSSSGLSAFDIRNVRFATAFRGYDVDEVRAFLHRVADSLDAIAESSKAAATLSLVRSDPSPIEEHSMTEEARALEELSARQSAQGLIEGARAEAEAALVGARAEARDIVARANDEAARIILRARAESRGRPSAEGTAVVQAAYAESPDNPDLAREQARSMIAEAKAVREKILTDLAKRRKVAHVQLEQLRVAKDKLQESLRETRRVIDDASRDLQTAEVEARLAAEREGRRVASEPTPTADELETELMHTRLTGLPQHVDVDLDAELSAVRASIAESSQQPTLPTTRTTEPDATTNSAQIETARANDVSTNESIAIAPDTSLDASGDNETGKAESTDDEVRGGFIDHAASIDHAAKSDGDAPHADEEAGTKDRVARVDDLFARLRSEREAAAESARATLASLPNKPDKPQKGGASKGSKRAAEPGATDAGSTGRSEKQSSRGGAVIELQSSTDSIPGQWNATEPAPHAPSSDASVSVLERVDLTTETVAAVLDLRAAEDAAIAVDTAETETEAATVIDLRDDRFEYVDGPLVSSVTRAIKRRLHDDQSAALAALRTVRGRVQLDMLVGPAESHVDRMHGELRAHFEDALRVGTEVSGRAVDDQQVEDIHQMAHHMVASIVESLRSELAAVIDTSDGNASDKLLVDGVATQFRGWTSDRISELVREPLRGAYRAGLGTDSSR